MNSPDQKREPMASDRAGGRLHAIDCDDQLRELIRQRLTEDPTLDASDVSLEVRGGRVRLEGTVASAGASSEIEQTVENCGALEVDNQLRALA